MFLLDYIHVELDPNLGLKLMNYRTTYVLFASSISPDCLEVPGFHSESPSLTIFRWKFKRSILLLTSELDSSMDMISKNPAMKTTCGLRTCWVLWPRRSKSFVEWYRGFTFAWSRGFLSREQAGTFPSEGLGFKPPEDSRIQPEKCCFGRCFSFFRGCGPPISNMRLLTVCLIFWLVLVLAFSWLYKFEGNGSWC